MTALRSERRMRSNLQKVQNPPNPFCNARDERGSERCSPGQQQGRDALPSSASVATWSTRPRRSDQKALRGGGAGGHDPRPPPAWQPHRAAGRVRKWGPHGHPGEQCGAPGASPGRGKTNPSSPKHANRNQKTRKRESRAERGGSHGGRRAHPARAAPLPLPPARPAAPPAAAPAHLQQHQEGGEAPLPAAELPRRPEGLLQPQRHGPPAAPRWRPRPAPPAGPELPAGRPGTGGSAALRSADSVIQLEKSDPGEALCELRTEHPRAGVGDHSRMEGLPRHKVARGRIQGDTAAFLPQKSTQSGAAGVTPGHSRTAQQLLRSCGKWEQLSSFHDRDFKRRRIFHQHLI